MSQVKGSMAERPRGFRWPTRTGKVVTPGEMTVTPRWGLDGLEGLLLAPPGERIRVMASQRIRFAKSGALQIRIDLPSVTHLGGSVPFARFAPA